MKHLTDKLWKSSNAIEQFFLQPDEHGIGEFKPKVAVVTVIIALVLIGLVTKWAG
jgi:hypothetical protein